MFLDAKPNKAHLKLAELEAAGKLTAVITQNIDGLHQAAGSKNVLELHGSIHRNYCMRCKKQYSARFVKRIERNPNLRLRRNYPPGCSSLRRRTG